MAVNKGKDGGFYVGSTLVTFIDTWNSTTAVSTDESTAFGDDWEKHVATVKNWNASFSGTLDRADANQAILLDQLEDGALASTVVRLGLDASNYWEGSAIVENMSIDSSVKGLVKLSGSLKGTAEKTWTET